MQPVQLYSLMLLAILFSSFSKAQGLNRSKPASAAQANKLAGTWKLVEYADFDSVAGKWQYDYGQHPQGFFTYTPGGIVNLNISADKPLKISEDSAKKYNINLLSWLYTNSVGYFGTYSVDFDKSIVTHHVTGGSLPWYVDTDQQRPFILQGDTLIIGDKKPGKGF